jgi:V8-like Glu-specific endopeptidase
VISSSGSYRSQLSDLPVELEKILHADPQAFVDPAGYRNAMIRAERCIARIENPEGLPQGTGFLISPSLLITNNHVRMDSGSRTRPFDACPTAVRARFGYVENGRASSRMYELDSIEWIAAESPETELDFCVLRLAEPAGDHRIGAESLSPVRGWIALDADSPAEHQSLSILQHPQGEPLKLAQGHLSSASSDWIEYHVNTDHGSSGSPVFDSRWRCVALHSRAGSTRNRGASSQAILRLLPDHVRDDLAPFGPAEEAQDVEGLAPATPGTLVDATVFSISEIQSIGSWLLRPDKGTSPQIKLGSGKILALIPSDFADDVVQRLGLKGSLELSGVLQATLQNLRRNYAINPTSLTSYSVVIQQQTDELLRTVDEIRSRVQIMVHELRLTRQA